MKILEYYLIIINIFTLIVYGLDKGRARSKKWRISEKTLLLLSLAGGSAGALAAMLLFRHKTRKLKFVVGVPVMFVIHCVIVALLVSHLVQQLPVSNRTKTGAYADRILPGGRLCSASAPGNTEN